MDGYKEFRGKTLDIAIEEACSYFNSAREKLEIEIVNDAKTGIFGLVGARKATVRARRMQVNLGKDLVKDSGKNSDSDHSKRDRKPSERRESKKPRGRQDDRSRSKGEADVSAKSGGRKTEKPFVKNTKQPSRTTEGAAEEKASSHGEQREERQYRERTPRRGTKPRRDSRPSDRNERTGSEREESSSSYDRDDSRYGDRRQPRRPVRGREERHGGRGSRFERNEAPRSGQGGYAEMAEPLPEANFDEMDLGQLISTVESVVNRLITPVIGETPIEAEILENRVKVTINSGENSGLLIGREGQTLAAFQYLTNRIVAKELGVALRVQLDTGDYRERQDEKLRDIALHLADKAKTLGKPQSTRPLSSYHRRIVHLALQEDDGIATRSKGDGPLKRVIIARKRRSSAASA